MNANNINVQSGWLVCLSVCLYSVQTGVDLLIRVLRDRPKQRHIFVIFLLWDE